MCISEKPVTLISPYLKKLNFEISKKKPFNLDLPVLDARPIAKSSVVTYASFVQVQK